MVAEGPVGLGPVTSPRVLPAAEVPAQGPLSVSDLVAPLGHGLLAVLARPRVGLLLLSATGEAGGVLLPARRAQWREGRRIP